MRERDKKLYIPVILGTARVGRQSEKVARFVFAELAKRPDVETELVDVKEYIAGRTVPPWEEHSLLEVWRKKAERADAFLIVSPEYNHSFPGELKMFIDSGYKEYFKKPMAIAGVSDGRIGGARMIEHLRQVIVTVGAVPILSSLYFFKVDELFDEKTGSIKDEGYYKRASECFDDLIWYAEALRAKREEKQ